MEDYSMFINFLLIIVKEKEEYHLFFMHFPVRNDDKNDIETISLRYRLCLFDIVLISFRRSTSHWVYLNILFDDQKSDV